MPSSQMPDVSRVTLDCRTVLPEALPCCAAKYSDHPLRIMECRRRKIMSVRSTLIQLAAKPGMLIAALFVVTVLLAAIPEHRDPNAEALPAPAGDMQSHDSSETQPQAFIVRANAGLQEADQNSQAGQQTSVDEKLNEQAAVNDMTRGADAHASHMKMTAMRPENPADLQRANEIASQLRAGIEKYKDYHVALEDGFHIFLPNVPQPEYHFTSYRNGFLEGFTFDPARPTSLLYKKTTTGYELVGAMYTMPKRATEDQLNARVPLSVAMWHLHTNLCMPPRTELKN